MLNITVLGKSRVSAITGTTIKKNGKETNPMSPATRPLSSGTVKFQKCVKNANRPMLKNIPTTKMIINLKTSFEAKKRRAVTTEVTNEHA